jgi:hypothetical protein
MGWVRDLVDDAIDWIEDHIVKPAVKWLTSMIEEIRLNLKNFMHTMKEWLAKWLENDWVFLTFVAVLIAAIFLLPQISQAIGNSGAWKAITTWVEAIVNKVVKLIDIKKYVDIHLIDTLLKTFVTEYREVRATMTKAVSGLAADLGEGTGFIHALLESGRGIYMGTGALLGTDARLSETEWYKDSSQFVKSVNDRFYHYARDPGAIYSDFFEKVLLPRAQEQATVNQAALDQIRSNYDRTVEIEGAITQIETSIDLFVETMPASIEEQFSRRWDDVRPIIEDLLEVMRDDIIPMFGEVKAAFEEHVSAQLQINEEFRRKFGAPVGLLKSYYLLPESEQAQTESLMEDIVLGKFEDIQKEESEAGSYWQSRLSALLDNTIDKFVPSPALAYEDVSSIGGKRKVPFDIPSPFVGEF